MSTRIVLISSTISNDAAFQAFVQMYHDSFIALGWLQTADTGQINPLTVLRPGTNTDAGYLIWSMNDSLQAASPIFCKMFFGIGAGATDPRFKIEIATKTNGAGTLQGNVSTQVSAVRNAGALVNSYFSGTSSRMQAAAWPSSSGACFTFSIERDRSASGVDTAFGASIIAYGAAAPIWFQQFVPNETQGLLPPSETKAVTMISGQTSQSGGGLTTVGVIRPVFGSFRNPGIGMLICSQGDFVNEVTNTVSLYGTSRRYITLTVATTMNTAAVGNNTSPGAFLLFE
jgi:hypothetical protein